MCRCENFYIKLFIVKMSFLNFLSEVLGIVSYSKDVNCAWRERIICLKKVLRISGGP